MNASDKLETVQKYIKDNSWSFPIVMGGDRDKYTLGKAYGVQAYPTNYLIGADGTILWRGVGFNETAMREAIEKAGIK